MIPTGQVQIAPSPPDWQVATGSVILNGTAYPTGEGIFDIGIDDMLLTLPGFPTTGNLADSNQLEMALLGLPAGTVGYSFTVGDASNTLGPTSVQWSALQPGAFSEGQTLFTLVNTGRDVMNAFNVLYDASNGYLGLQLNNLSGGSSAFLTPTIGANGTMMFPDGFTTNLPMNLLSNTTISTGGTVTFNGPLTGSGAHCDGRHRQPELHQQSAADRGNTGRARGRRFGKRAGHDPGERQRAIYAECTVWQPVKIVRYSRNSFRAAARC